MSPIVVPRTPEDRSIISPIDLAEAGMSGLLDAAPLAGLDLPCRSATNPDLWFAEAPTDLERAKELCGTCPVRAECLAGAVARQSPGVSGVARSSSAVWSSRASAPVAARARTRPSRPTPRGRRHDHANHPQANSPWSQHDVAQ